MTKLPRVVRKTAAVVSAVALSAPLLASGATAAGASTLRPAAQTTTLQVWTMETASSFTQLLQGFTKETGIKVQVEQVPWANVNDKLTTAVASGNGPDVVEVGLSELPSFVAAGALLNLKPYLKANPVLQDNHYLAAVSSKVTSPRGEDLSVPWVSDVRILFYRSDILKQAGISAPPKTWAQLFQDATKLAQRGTNQYGFYIPQWDSALPVELTWQAGGQVTGPNGKVTFNSAAFRAAVNFYTSFYKDKLVPTASDFDQTQGFISGAAPMLISGPYLAASINSEAPDLKGKWDVAPLPKDKDGTSLFAGSNMGIWYKSKNVAASLKLLDYLAKPSTQLQWFKLADELPTNTSALDAPSLISDPMVRVYVDQLRNAEPLPLAPQWNQISTDLLNSLNSIVLDGANEQATLSKLNTTVASLQH